MMKNRIYFGDNLPILQNLEDETINLIYIDPPFNTGKKQKRTRIKTDRSDTGDRIGFSGNRYQTIEIGTQEFADSFTSSRAYLDFLQSRLIEAYRLLSPDGSLYFHLDYREVHYCKVFLLDEIFGRDCFLNEIIWAYDFGGRPKNKWPPKHDNILVYVKDATNYVFNYEDIERIPYMSPGLVGKEKALKGKIPTDTWWHTIVPTNSKERTGYPTQKPVEITNRIIQASSNPGDTVLDFFAGSGSVGESCISLDRKFILVDNNLQAMKVMAKRFKDRNDIEWIGFDPKSHLNSI
jgi:site-specific DNA-methyltransferase (adenine-specific)